MRLPVLLDRTEDLPVREVPRKVPRSMRPPLVSNEDLPLPDRPDRTEDLPSSRKVLLLVNSKDPLLPELQDRLEDHPAREVPPASIPTRAAGTRRALTEGRPLRTVPAAIGPCTGVRTVGSLLVRVVPRITASRWRPLQGSVRTSMAASR